jgi:regulator of protease activity HflC (stomatin/prohibitin superfamily)
MAVDEAARHQLYNSLEATLGPEPTSTLMSLLPPVGWADVATKQDLAALENNLRTAIDSEVGGLCAEFAAVRIEMAQLRSDLSDAMRRQMFGLVGAMFTLAGLTWAATSIA